MLRIHVGLSVLRRSRRGLNQNQNQNQARQKFSNTFDFLILYNLSVGPYTKYSSEINLIIPLVSQLNEKKEP